MARRKSIQEPEEITTQETSEVTETTPEVTEEPIPTAPVNDYVDGELVGDKIVVPPVRKKIDKNGVVHKPEGEYLDCVVEVLYNDIFNRKITPIAIYDIYMDENTLYIKNRKGQILSTSTKGLRRAMQLHLSRMYSNMGLPKGVTLTYTVIK